MVQKQLKFLKHMKGHWKMIILQIMNDVSLGKCFCIR
ncbi:hypothetical protein POPTR_001G177802v4 [Populus trichocarpa]|uniref:Uncharacterized protein n=1 Tax=Populus trichocarpa TaxID=3694 RepID=A0ACC0TJM6_POPTR|nr:hypothetical protein BDE02_01G160900 [Populus trichocarpa]KAI9401834.1 hypothetical protein POPTR_001G177802v4 [Populus trichocarpa]